MQKKSFWYKKTTSKNKKRKSFFDELFSSENKKKKRKTYIFVLRILKTRINGSKRLRSNCWLINNFLNWKAIQLLAESRGSNYRG